MTSFTARVELHDATWKDYETLHDRMRSQGFATTIKGSDGIIYRLPPAEYRYDGSLSISDALARAKLAAAGVKTKYAVLVTEGAGCMWYGLERANAYA